MITPKDIQEVEFPNSVRGYAKRSVDEFLDAVTIDYQSMIEELKTLKEENEKLNAELSEFRDSKDSVVGTLEQAKRLMTDISSSAERRANITIKNANFEAESIVREAKESVVRYTNESERLQKRLEEFRKNFKTLLMNELSKLDGTVDDLFIELKEDFDTPTALSASTETSAASTTSTVDTIQAPSIGKTIIMDKPKVDNDTTIEQIDSEIAANKSGFADISFDDNIFEKRSKDVDMTKTIVIEDMDELLKSKDFK